MGLNTGSREFLPTRINHPTQPPILKRAVHKAPWQSRISGQSSVRIPCARAQKATGFGGQKSREEQLHAIASIVGAILPPKTLSIPELVESEICCT